MLSCALASAVMSGCNSGGSNEKNDGNAASGSSTSSPNGSQDASGDSKPSAASSNNDQVIFDVNGTKVYSSGVTLFAIKDDNTFEFCLLEEDPEKNVSENEHKTHNTGFGSEQVVVDGSDVYGLCFDDFQIYHWDLTDLNAVKKRLLYSEDVMEAAAKTKLESLGLSDDSEELSKVNAADIGVFDKVIDGGDGYCYMSLGSNIETAKKLAAFNFSVCRFAKDGSKIEFVDDIRACSMTASDGWLYYFDSGYTGKYTSDGKSDVSVDSSKSGIYKCRTDGSEKKQLVSGIKLIEGSYDGDISKIHNTITHMSVINNSLYYINNSEDGKGCLYKVGLDGGTPEKVTEKSCANYYIDTQTKTLYYFEGKSYELETFYTFISKDLESGTERQLFRKGSISRYKASMSVLGDYVYFADPNEYLGWNAIDVDKSSEPYYHNYISSGQRWKLSSNELEKLECTVEVKFVEDPVTYVRNFSHILSAPEIKWVKQDSLSENDGLMLYK